MREFVVLGHEAPTTADFDLDALASGAGRLDLLCRCVGAALFLSHGIREDTAVSLVIRDEVTVTFRGDTLRGASPDERSLAGLVRSALDDRDRAIGRQRVDVAPGIEVASFGLEVVLDDASDVVCLQEAGRPIAEVEPPDSATFVLSDHRSFTDAEATVIDQLANAQYRVSPKALHADHTISVVHNYLDTNGYREY